MNNYEIDKLYTYICLEFKNYRTSDNVNKKQEEVAFDLNI
ncbi:XRE family transcriptional regulator, partial [Staphylococcus aureus]